MAGLQLTGQQPAAEQLVLLIVQLDASACVRNEAELTTVVLSVPAISLPQLIAHRALGVVYSRSQSDSRNDRLIHLGHLHHLAVL